MFCKSSFLIDVHIILITEGFTQDLPRVKSTKLLRVLGYALDPLMKKGRQTDNGVGPLGTNALGKGHAK